MFLPNAVALSHFYAENTSGEGGVCIDATAGNGNDTAFLAQLVGETGKVYAFDVQQQAIDSTHRRLTERGLRDRVQLVLDSHANVRNYVSEPVDVMVFNLGRLPRSDHAVYTRAESTIAAIEAGLDLLKKDGLICLSAYWGDPICCEEYRRVYDYIKTISPRRAEALFHEFINEPNCPPTFFALCKR
ncbi:MAG: class I SAM-dependent methyltransferase [Christensenellaceae bacterium]|nr:class I SAM-dependent methyltransferase [Christensenellaceae bacterium]